MENESKSTLPDNLFGPWIDRMIISAKLTVRQENVAANHKVDVLSILEGCLGKVKHRFEDRWTFRTLSIEGQGRLLYTNASYLNNGKEIRLSTTLVLNPTRALALAHSLDSHISSLEKSLDGNNNWLPVRILQGEQVGCARLASEYADFEINSLMSQLLQSFQKKMPNASVSCRFYLGEIEVYFELLHHDPPLFLVENEGRIEELFRQTSESSYARPVKSREVNGNLHCLRGSNQKGTTLKLYGKTNHRVRIEGQFSTYALERLTGSRELMPPLAVAIENRVKVLQKILSQFYLSLQDTSPHQMLHPDQFRYLHDFIGCVRSHELCMRYIQALSVCRHIVPSNGDYHILERMQKRGLIGKTGRGVYAISKEQQAILRRFTEFLYGPKE